MKTETAVLKLITEIEIRFIHPSPYQKRKNFDKEEIKSLAANIAQIELLHPITVRIMEQKIDRRTTDEWYELVAGEKRLRAFKLLDRVTIPAIVRTMTDAEAATACAVENLHRSDLTPLEEADSVAQALVTMTREEVAEAFGKSVSWIAKRSRLMQLTENWKKEIESGFAVQWPAAHLELIARLPQETQNRFCEEYKHYEMPILSELKEETDREQRSLSSAPWKQEEGEKPCSKCQDRSDADISLFDDIAKAKDGKCLNRACWTEKTRVHIQAEIAKAPKGILKVDMSDSSASRNFEYNDPIKESALKSWNVTKVNKKTPGAVPALCIEGTDAGKIIYIEKPEQEVINEQVKESRPKTMEQKRAGLEKRRTILLIKKVMEKIAIMFNEKDIAQQDIEVAIDLACRFGSTCYGKELNGYGYNEEPFSAEQKYTPGVSSLILCILPVINDLLGKMTSYRNPEEKHVVLICQWLLIDWQPLWAQVLEEIKEPKSWAKEEKFA